MKTNVIIAGLVLAWLVSPETLVLLGQVAGNSGKLAVIPLLFGGTLACLSATLIHNPTLAQSGKAGEYAILATVYGRIAASSIVMTGRIPMLLFASTGILVSAGFAFNEIFIYWFPNFLFASVLLTGICILNFFDEKYALGAQVFFVGIVVVGLLILIVMGHGGSEQTVVPDLVSSRHLSFSNFSLAFLLFLGFDFHQTRGEGMAPVLVTLVLAFLLLAGWAVLAHEYVIPTKLAGSSISYLLVAKAVGGETGRYLMGGIVIFGALSGTNGLFIVVRRSLVGMVDNKIFSKILSKSWPVAIFFAILVETMMMTGVAGEDILETQLLASILLWLLMLGLRSYAAGVHLAETGIGGKALGILVSFTLLILMGYLVVANDQTGYIIRFQAVSMIVFFIFSFILMKTQGK